MSRRSSRIRSTPSRPTRRRSSYAHARSAEATLGYRIEHLETRLLLAASVKQRYPLLVDNSQPVIELAPETIDPKTGISPPSGRVADPANIIWINRGLASDGFATVFGTLAATARAVVDAVIVRYEEMIGSFDYSLAGQTYSLTLSMSASGGFGASASLLSNLGGKPKSGSISMLRGNSPASTNIDHGWFLDPTPFDNSEFTGNIVNAFSGDAQAGSPAAGKGDFFAVVASEMTHCMGLFGASLAGWSSHSTNTGILDTVTGVGRYWVFQGPSINHLGTSDNAGSQDFGALIHSAESASNINFNAQNWIGAEDQGNAFFEFDRRYMVNNTFALMFKDAYGYLSTNPASTGTMYTVYNETTDQLLVRGGDFSSGHTPSSDVISISRSGTLITVSINIGDDVAGTGPFSGDQNLGAFVTTIDTATSPIASILVQAGAGNDTITLNSLGSGMPTTIQAGDGNDSITIGNGDIDSFIFSNVTVQGGNGTDDMFFNDSTDDPSVADSYTLTSTTFDKSSSPTTTFDTVEDFIVTAGLPGNAININTFSNIGTGIQSLVVNANDGDDFITVGSGDVENQLAFIDLTVNGNAGNDTVRFDDTTDPEGTDAYTLTSTTFDKNTGGVEPPWIYGTMENVIIDCNPFNNDVTISNFTANVTVNGNAGDDTFHQGPADMNTNWNGNLTINGGAGTADAINLDDSGDLTADAYTITATTFQITAGLTTNPFVYGTVESFNWLTNTNPTQITISGTASGTTYLISGSDGIDNFTVGTGNLDLLDGPLTVAGDAGSDRVIVDDSLNGFSDAYVLTSTFLDRGFFAGLTYGTVESLQLTAEIGSNTFDVQSTLATTPVTINGNDGADAMIIPSVSADWDLSILGSVTFNGDGGTDSLRILDTNDVGADNYTITATQTTKSSVASVIGYGSIEDYTLQANNDANTILVISSFPAPFRIFANGGADTINIQGNFLNSFVLLDGGAGLDNVSVNTDSAGIAAAHFDTTQDLASLNILTGGTVVMETNGSRVIDTDGLSIVGNGKLDLTDNDMIVDYVGASQMNAIIALINAGRNGGAWNGSGITSSAAQSNPLHNTTLGRLEGSEYDVLYGAAALFDGRTVDNTAVIVKYTYYGDTDLNGVVNFDDYSRTDAGFNFGRSGWLNGDFDGNGTVNFDDYSLIDLAFNTQGVVL